MCYLLFLLKCSCVKLLLSVVCDLGYCFLLLSFYCSEKPRKSGILTDKLKFYMVNTHCLCTGKNPLDCDNTSAPFMAMYIHNFASAARKVTSSTTLLSCLLQFFILHNSVGQGVGFPLAWESGLGNFGEGASLTGYPIALMSPESRN